ncbi:hypothetical protein [Spongiactinospora sp. TRM90649]|uniref:hypothetical protein n=1 Tax=Spongiactinospora sp. TRM90649 TaxID=3031114 RepID=UPI0023F8AAE8|nr:hypothetical protein [Spongiactinospora sp. TRM90649]MDF5754122.1 hypothetical protein [Spongiactinospora sp. TRM90649]
MFVKCCFSRCVNWWNAAGPPSRTVTVAVAALVCVPLAGCGTETAIYADVSAAREQARIRDLLRDLPDLPEGFSPRPREGWSPPFRAADANCRTVLEAVAGRPPRAKELRTHAEATFYGERVGELGGASVASFTADAAESFDALGEALDGCTGAVRRNPGDATLLVPADLPLTIGELELGDGTAGTRLHGRLNGYPYDMHLVFVQSGRTLISVVHAAMGTADATRTEGLARAVTARMTGEPE